MLYKELLEKYMQHVMDVDGSTFMSRSGYGSEVEFTPEELEELSRMSERIYERY